MSSNSNQNLPINSQEEEIVDINDLIKEGFEVSVKGYCSYDTGVSCPCGNDILTDFHSSAVPFQCHAQELENVKGDFQTFKADCDCICGEWHELEISKKDNIVSVRVIGASNPGQENPNLPANRKH